VNRGVLPAASALDGVVFEFEELPQTKLSAWKHLLELVHRHSVGVFALLLLIVGGSAIQVAGAYKAAQISLASTTVSSKVHVPAQPLHGPNTVVLNSQLPQTLQHISSQPISLVIGPKTVPVNADTIKSWLQVVADQKKGVAYIHVNETAITKSLNEAAVPYIKAPVNQVSVTHPDGSQVSIAAGRNGTKLGDVGPAAKQIGAGLLGAKGMQPNLPVESLAFAVITPSSFDKLLEVNVNSKQMWAYEKGQLVRQFAISAGAPATPTPIGQFKIYSKPAVQDMKGLNPDGSKYLQPHVRWINYFLPGGYAIHGNYWRPLSAFGAVNTSHGCVSLPEDQAKWVYDWAPIGTTVITHY